MKSPKKAPPDKKGLARTAITRESFERGFRHFHPASHQSVSDEQMEMFFKIAVDYHESRELAMNARTLRQDYQLCGKLVAKAERELEELGDTLREFSARESFRRSALAESFEETTSCLHKLGERLSFTKLQIRGWEWMRSNLSLKRAVTEFTLDLILVGTDD